MISSANNNVNIVNLATTSMNPATTTNDNKLIEENIK